jgi:hypothetical protein
VITGFSDHEGARADMGHYVHYVYKKNVNKKNADGNEKNSSGNEKNSDGNEYTWYKISDKQVVPVSAHDAANQLETAYEIQFTRKALLS